MSQFCLLLFGGLALTEDIDVFVLGINARGDDDIIKQNLTDFHLLFGTILKVVADYIFFA